jgi:hypothetical protein
MCKEALWSVMELSEITIVGMAMVIMMMSKNTSMAMIIMMMSMTALVQRYSVFVISHYSTG